MLELGRCQAGHIIVGEASVIRRGSGVRCRECAHQSQLRRELGLPPRKRPAKQTELGRCNRAGHEWNSPDDFTEYVYHDPTRVRRVVVCHVCQREAAAARHRARSA